MMKLVLFTLFFLQFAFCWGQVRHVNDDDRKIKIPVIFHLFHSDKNYNLGNNRHKNDNLSDSLILEELRDLNQDFSATNDMAMMDQDYKTVIGNPNIEFYLADTILQPNGSNGILRIHTNNNDNSLFLKSEVINPEKYLNVYIGNVGSATNLNSDKVSLNFSEIGLHTHVLTHETGHWLGLYHIWGKIGSCNRFKAFFAGDDDIKDTPNQRRCSDLSYGNCPPKRIKKNRNKPMYNNFMDYSGCRCMFTKMQSIKMRNNIIGLRPKIFHLSSI